MFFFSAAFEFLLFCNRSNLLREFHSIYYTYFILFSDLKYAFACNSWTGWYFNSVSSLSKRYNNDGEISFLSSLFPIDDLIVARPHLFFLKFVDFFLCERVLGFWEGSGAYIQKQSLGLMKYIFERMISNLINTKTIHGSCWKKNAQV